MLDLEVVPERSLGNEQWELVLGMPISQVCRGGGHPMSIYSSDFCQMAIVVMNWRLFGDLLQGTSVSNQRRIILCICNEFVLLYLYLL